MYRKYYNYCYRYRQPPAQWYYVAVTLRHQPLPLFKMTKLEDRRVVINTMCVSDIEYTIDCDA